MATIYQALSELQHNPEPTRSLSYKPTKNLRKTA